MTKFWHEIRRRAARPAFAGPTALAAVGMVWYFSAVAADRMPDGWSLFLTAPAVIGVLLWFAGVVWIRSKTDETPPSICPRCGYDLRAHGARDRCPECGASPLDGTKSRPVFGIFVQAIGWLLIAAGVVSLVFGAVYSLAWQAGWLGAI